MCVCACVAVGAVELSTVRTTKWLLKMTSSILSLPWVYPGDLASRPESGLKNMGVIPAIRLESGLGRLDWTQLSSDITHWLLTVLSLFSLRPVGRGSAEVTRRCFGVRFTCSFPSGQTLHSVSVGKAELQCRRHHAPGLGSTLLCGWMAR